MGDGEAPEPAPAGTAPGVDPTALQIVRTPVTLVGLEAMAESMFGNLVKAVVDVERGVMAIGGEMHADEEALLLGDGSPQASLWGINLYPAEFGSARFIEFDSVVNIRPRLGNRTRSVDDAVARAAITAVVDRLVTR
jgi:hypothetical protein